MLNLSVRILQAGNALLTPDWWRYSIKKSRFWSIYLSDRTGTHLVFPRKTYKLNTDDLYLIPAGLTYNCHVTGSVRQAWFTFDTIQPASVMMEQLFPAPLLIQSTPALRALIRETAAPLPLSAKITFSLDIQVKAIVYQVMSSAFAQLPQAQLETWLIAGSQSAIAPALTLIEENIALPHDNQSLAQACHMSEFHFIRSFKSIVGQPPARYLRERRISKAAQALRFSDASIKTIAEQTGFANRFHMTRLFTRLTGKTPAAFRKEARL